MKENQWIQTGYKVFSKEGPSGLKIEKMARLLGISKSSFYHKFADLEVFQEKLLDFHLIRAHEIAIKAKSNKVMVPDQLYLMVEIKEDLLFNRQLRIHRENPMFEICIGKTNNLVADSLKTHWAEDLKLIHKPHIAQNVLDLTIDVFFSRITEENLNYEWLLAFLNEIKLFIKKILETKE